MDGFSEDLLALRKRMAAYALYFAGKPDYIVETALLYGELRRMCMVSPTFGSWRLAPSLFQPYLDAAQIVRGNTKYETTNVWPPEQRDAHVLVVGTYIPEEEISRVLEQL